MSFRPGGIAILVTLLGLSAASFAGQNRNIEVLRHIRAQDGPVPAHRVVEDCRQLDLIALIAQCLDELREALAGIVACLVPHR